MPLSLERHFTSHLSHRFESYCTSGETLCSKLLILDICSTTPIHVDSGPNLRACSRACSAPPNCKPEQATVSPQSICKSSTHRLRVAHRSRISLNNMSTEVGFMKGPTNRRSTVRTLLVPLQCAIIPRSTRTSPVSCLVIKQQWKKNQKQEIKTFPPQNPSDSPTSSTCSQSHVEAANSVP